jgi:hypothetical protein
MERSLPTAVGRRATLAAGHHSLAEHHQIGVHSTQPRARTIIATNTGTTRRFTGDHDHDQAIHRRPRPRPRPRRFTGDHDHDQAIHRRPRSRKLGSRNPFSVVVVRAEKRKRAGHPQGRHVTARDRRECPLRRTPVGDPGIRAERTATRSGGTSAGMERSLPTAAGRRATLATGLHRLAQHRQIGVD